MKRSIDRALTGIQVCVDVTIFHLLLPEKNKQGSWQPFTDLAHNTRFIIRTKAGDWLLFILKDTKGKIVWIFLELLPSLCVASQQARFFLFCQIGVCSHQCYFKVKCVYG